MISLLSRHATLALLLGGGLLAVVLLANDPLLTWARVTDAGWAIVLVSAYRAVPLALDTAGWRLLFDPGDRPPPGPAWVARWIGESVNALLPMAQVGGDVVRAQLVAKEGRGGMAASGAATMADFTLGLVAQVLFTVAGGVLLVGAVTPERQPVSSPALASAVVAFSALILGFFLWQRRGGPGRLRTLLARASRRFGPGLDQDALDGFDRRLRGVYGRPGAMMGCVAWRLLGWLARTGETGIVLWLLGVAVEPQHLVIIESLTYAVRSIAFFVPGALGVQEAGLLGIGLALGLSPDVALALAVIKRAREAAVGLPALAVWAFRVGHEKTETKPST